MPKATFQNLAPGKQQRIVQAAVSEFSSTPYVRANLDRIAAGARVSKGSLYQYFSGKLDLYRYLILEVLPAKKMRAIEQCQKVAPTSVWEHFEQAFLAGLQFSIQEPELTRLGVRFLRDADQACELAELAAAQRTLGQRWVTEKLTQGQAKGEVRESLDLAYAAPIVAHALGEGSIDAIASQLGLTRHEYLSSPEKARELSSQQRQSMIRALLSFLRHGMEPQA